MRVAYDVHTINALAGADARASASLAWLSAESLVDAADIGIADVEALVSSPTALVRLRAHLIEVVAEAGVATANSGTLSVEMYYQAAAYISAETGWPIGAVLVYEMGTAGAKATVHLVKTGAKVLDDLYFGEIRSTKIPDEQTARPPVEIIDVGAEFGGTYEVVTGKVEVTFRIEKYPGGYRVVMVTTVFGGVGNTKANAGVVRETEVSWDVADLDSAKRLVARLALIAPEIAATTATAGGLDPGSLSIAVGTYLSGALLRIPKPSEIKVSGGVRLHEEVGPEALTISAVTGTTIDPSGSGVPSLTPFGKIEAEGSFDIAPLAGVKGKASIEVDPTGITIEIEGTFKAGPHTEGLKAGKIYELQGTLKIPAGALDPRLIDRVLLGDVDAVREVMHRLHDGASGDLSIYEGVDAEIEVDGGVVVGGGHATHKHLVDTIGFGHEG